MQPSKTHCIIHIDMDAFYAQVEAKRHNLSPSEPLVVRQWSMIIAANYPAKALGLARGMYMKHITERYPSVHVVHVDTISPDNVHHMYDLDSKVFPDQQIEKVTLKRYRDESNKLMRIFEENCGLVEKASIDEAYLDVTDEVEYTCELVDGFEDYYYDEGLWIGKMAGERFAPTSREDKLLAVASQLASDIRERVFKEFGYTCSAGVAHNKLMAKLASGMNKPNGQAVIPMRYINAALSNTPIAKIKNFGGKVAQKCESKGIKTVGELQKKSLEELVKMFGTKSHANWIYERARGIDTEEVKARQKPKSMEAFKTFKMISRFEDLIPIIKILCIELRERLMAAFDENKCYPSQLVLEFSDESLRSKRSKTFEMLPRNQLFDEAKGLENFQEYAIGKFKSIKGTVLPAKVLGLGAKNFADVYIPKEEEKSISRKATLAEEEKEEPKGAKKKRKAIVLGEPKAGGKKTKKKASSDIRTYVSVPPKAGI